MATTPIVANDGNGNQSVLKVQDEANVTHELCPGPVQHDAGICMDLTHKLSTLFRLIQVAPLSECQATVLPAIVKAVAELNLANQHLIQLFELIDASKPKT